ncbi:MAG: hypothetical protein LBN21_08505, partial [Treponema sp.]|nr:hypothetical protein [Treponema sp.]
MKDTAKKRLTVFLSIMLAGLSLFLITCDTGYDDDDDDETDGNVYRIQNWEINSLNGNNVLLYDDGGGVLKIGGEQQNDNTWNI